MYPRETIVRRRGKIYRYVKIVHGYRRADGVSTQRVIANLGQMSRQAYSNLKAAFKASREGKTVVIPDDALNGIKRDKVRANLRYLDVAVMQQMWESWGLGPMLSGLIGNKETTVPTCDVIEVLTLQRCIAPRSKLYAQEWFPTTALPELLGIPLGQFNNTRVHRALNTLYKCGPQLQEKLTNLYQDGQAAFAAMFLDVTDTWFEGRGCESAKRSRTKAGHRNKKCIGIVLLCNELGYPLRWMVIPGKTKDHHTMREMADDIKRLDWAHGVPLVCDRAMGQHSSVEALRNTGLHFLTAAHVDSIESFTSALPYELISKVTIGCSEHTRKNDVKIVANAAREAKLEEVDEHLFVKDLGIVHWSPPEKDKRRCNSGIGERLRDALKFQQKLDKGQFKSKRELATTLEISPARLRQILGPLKLASSLQEEILASKHDVPVTAARMHTVLKERDAGEQRRLLQDVVDALNHPTDDDEQRVSVQVEDKLRLVAYFNPQMFVDQRRRAKEHLDEFQAFVAELNEELANAQKSRDEEATRRKIVRMLEKRNWVDLFDVHLEPIKLRDGSISSFRCEVVRRDEAWTTRHRYDGFVLLLGHHGLAHSGRELALLYRAKDTVEKDFQCIKSVVKLRPIFHREDPKVVAHVDLCMLALLLERSLEHQLASAGLSETAASTIDQLATCHLNLMRPGAGGPSFYSVTEPTKTQRRVLDALELPRLIDDGVLAGELTPRFVST